MARLATAAVVCAALFGRAAAGATELTLSTFDAAVYEGGKNGAFVKFLAPW